MATRKNPGGGKGQDRLWSDAIRLAAFRRLEKGGARALQIAADKLLELAMSGDVAALREVGDRLEGKARSQDAGPALAVLHLTFGAAGHGSALVETRRNGGAASLIEHRPA